jgi:PAS domain S-box-containing protein
MSDKPPRAVAPRTGVSLVASTDTPALLVAVDGRVLTGNAAAASLLGYSAEQLHALSVSTFVRADTQRTERDQLMLALETRTTFTGDLLLARATGSPLRCFLTAVPVPGLPGEPAQQLLLIDDRSSRLFAVEATPIDEWSAQALLDRMPAGVVVHAPDTRILYANARAAEVLGVTFDRLVGVGSPDPRWEFVDARGAPLTVDAFPVNRVVATGEPVRGLLIGTRRPSDGTQRWGLCDAFPLRDAAGVLAAIVVSFADVSQLRQEEVARRESEERLQLVLEATNDALWDMNLITGSAFCSARFWGMLGYAEGERSTDEASWIDVMHPEDRDRALAGINADIARGADTYESEFRMIHKAGHAVHVLSRGRILRDASGTPVRMAGTNTDISARRAFDERLRQSQKLESIGQLAGGVAHDFNNLLAVIRGNLELLEVPGTPFDEIVELAHEAQDAARRGSDLTRRLLAFARQQPLQLLPVQVGPLLLDYVRVLRRLIPESIAIDTRVDDALPPIRADAGLLETAILNLAINARDAMPDGGTLTLHARVVAPNTADRTVGTRASTVEISVRDTGIGMSRETVERAIEPFYTTKKSGHGSGLGLSMVYGFVQQCSGTLDIQSSLGAGTTVRLRFPATVVNVESVAPAPAATNSAIRVGGTVLVVEDDAAVRRLCLRELASMGYRCLEAIDGPSALERHALAGRVDLLLTDVIMPGGMNGVDVATALCARQPDLHVVYMSGYHADVLGDYLRTDSAQLLAKPFTIAELRDMIARTRTEPA